MVESASLFKYFKKVDTLEDANGKRSSNVMKVEVQVHTPPSTPSKWKRKSLPTPPPKVPDTPDTMGGRRKSSRISEKRLKEETRRMEDEIVVLDDEREKKTKKDDDDDLFIVKERKKSTLSPGPQNKVKIASIFVKKPKMSTLEKEARQRFLQSGVPEAIRRQTELLRKQEEILEELQFYSFPVINHVTQTLSTSLTSGPNHCDPHDLGRFKWRSGEIGETLREDSEMVVENDDAKRSDPKTENLKAEELEDTKGGNADFTRVEPKCGRIAAREVSEMKSLMQMEWKETVESEEWTEPSNLSKALNVLKKRVPRIEESSVFKRVAELTKTTTDDAQSNSTADHKTDKEERKRVSHRKKTEIEEVKREIEDPLLLWSEKYKPERDRDILGNGNSVETLKNWLETRKKATRRPYHSDSSDYESDFIDEEDSPSSSKHNTAILIGPSGCGKTCAVYALANQLGYKVIELNASCNRNGKRILADLSEATQSHQVAHQPQSSGQITNFFGVKNSGLFANKPNTNTPTSPEIIDLESSVEEKRNEIKKGVKRKRKRKDDEGDTEEEEEEFVAKKSGRDRRKSGQTAKKGGKNIEVKDKSGKKSLEGKNTKVAQNSSLKNSGICSMGNSMQEKIPPSVGKNSFDGENVDKVGEDGGKSQSIILIEDADILFTDYDEGFVAALTSLVATSKRPLILVANAERVTHLSKLMRSPSSLVLMFQTPLYAEIGCYLQLVSILEGIKLSQDKSLLLVQHNRGDVRKCLLTLQYYVLSKRVYTLAPGTPDVISGSHLTSLWWRWSSLYNLPPFITNHARTCLTRSDNETDAENNEKNSLGADTKDIGSDSKDKTKDIGANEKPSFLDDKFFCGDDDDVNNTEQTRRKDEEIDGENKTDGSKMSNGDIDESCTEQHKVSPDVDVDIVNSNEAMEVDESDLMSQNIEAIESHEIVAHVSGKESPDDESNTNETESNKTGKTKDSQESGYNSGLSQQLSQQPAEKEMGSSDEMVNNCDSTNKGSNNMTAESIANENLDSVKTNNENATTKSIEIKHGGDLFSAASCDPSRKSSHFESIENLEFLKAQFGRKWDSLQHYQKERAGMQDLATMLRCVSQADLIQRKLNLSLSADMNPCPQLWEMVPSASSSLDYDFTSSSDDVIGEALCETLASCGRALLPSGTVPRVNEPCEETKRSTQAVFTLQHSLLSTLSPAESISRLGFPLDLYSGIRTLARNEAARFATSSKRYNRFFNHLKSVGIHLSQSDTERLCRTLWLE